MSGSDWARSSELERCQADLIPAGVRWYQTSATRVDPANDSVHCADGTVVRGADLLLAPGARINWDAVPGALDGLQGGQVCTPSCRTTWPAPRR
jgi:NADPH-dependent 2,4-dienoyl-CoA reductase/sulfur reductase-like enzyme